MTGRCTRWERWLPGSGGRLKVLNCNLHSFQLFEIIQVLDSISWVRCASGNVSLELPIKDVLKRGWKIGDLVFPVFRILF